MRRFRTLVGVFSISLSTEKSCERVKPFLSAIEAACSRMLAEVSSTNPSLQGSSVWPRRMQSRRDASGGDRPARACVQIECFFLPLPYFFQTFSRQNFVARIDCDSRSNRRAGRYTTETDERLRETGPLSIARNRFELKTQTGRVSAAKNVACQIYIPADRLRDNGL